MSDEKVQLFEGFTLDTARGCLLHEAHEVHLRPQSYEVLKYLVENRGRLISKDRLIEKVWQGRAVTDGALGKCIEEVRGALGQNSKNYLRNVRGRGYIFDSGVEGQEASGELAARSEQIDAVRVVVEDEEPDEIEATPRAPSPPAPASSPQAAAWHAQPERQPPSIAVLPFANLSADKENEYFSDGLAEEVINLLARISGLKVIARTSAFAFKGKHEDIRRIAEAMDVTNILEGSVRRAGNRIRVTTQLIAAVDGSHLWSERYDRELSDVFAIQDEIAHAIAAMLRVKLAAKLSQYKPNLPAYEALLQGRHYRQKFTPEAHASAKKCFEQAIALDPNYAAPHAELGLNYLISVTNAVRTLSEVAPFIRAEARKALELDTSEGNSQLLLGAVAAAHDYDWQGAADHFAKAMAGGSVSAEARWCYAVYYLRALGLRQEAVAQMQRAVEQDPLNVTWRAILAHLLSTTEFYDRALEELRKALEFDENHWLPNFVLAETSLALGNLPEAVAAAEKAYRANPRHSMTWGIFAAVLARLGQKDRAAALVREGGESPNPIWGRVLYHLSCSEIDQAASWYERMIQHREPFAIIFASDSVLKPLRASADWSKLARLMNLPELV